MSGAFEPPKSRTVAILLALFLGNFGAHRFYVNQPGNGIVYLLFSWTLIPWLVAIVEGLVYAVMTDEEFREFCAPGKRR